MSFKERADYSLDYYAKRPHFQPKKEIANLVEKRGLNVPHRFKDLRDALDSRKPFIMRSECPAEFEGISDLLKSYRITRQTVGDAKINTKLLNEKGLSFFCSESQVLSQIGNTSQDELELNLKLLSIRDIESYCNFLRIDFDKFFSEISFSYWELLGGYNRTIVADSAIPDRYHIFTSSANRNENSYGYKIIENEKVVANSSRNLPIEEDNGNGALIDLYETVRGNKNRCPLVEAQTYDNKQWFLQAHKGTDYNPSRFTLDHKPKKDEMEAVFVRGATLPEGSFSRVNLYAFCEKGSLTKEDGALDMISSKIYSELMLRERKLEIIPANNIDSISGSVGNGAYHLTKSRLFKPAMSICLKEEDVNNLFKKTAPRYNEIPKVNLRIRSDGRKAYVKLLG